MVTASRIVNNICKSPMRVRTASGTGKEDLRQKVAAMVFIGDCVERSDQHGMPVFSG
jgi:hypothetical protein